MFKLCIKFVFFPIIIVMVGMYYLFTYLTIAITTIVSGVVICRSVIKSNKAKSLKEHSI